MAKKHSWVLRLTETCKSGKKGQFWSVKLSLYAGPLRDAILLDSRDQARGLCGSSEMVCKVSLTKNGKPKKVIKRG